jgi:hypothetical protein
MRLVLAPGVAPVRAHQGMLFEVVVEDLDLTRGDRARRIAHHAAVVAVEVAQRKGGEVRADQRAKRSHAALREPPRRVLADGAQGAQRGVQVPARERGHRGSFYLLVSHLSTN